MAACHVRTGREQGNHIQVQGFQSSAVRSSPREGTYRTMLPGVCPGTRTASTSRPPRSKVRQGKTPRVSAYDRGRGSGTGARR